MTILRHLPAMLLFLALLLIRPHPGWTFDLSTDTWQGHIDFSAIHFNYQEFADDGHLLDQEKGVLPGIVSGLTWNKNHTFVAGEMAYHAGTLPHEEPTLSLDTNEALWDFTLQVGHEFNPHPRIDFTVYGGLGYHRWERDILSTPTVIGPLEVYTWWEGFLGTQWALVRTLNSVWQVDAQLTRTIAPQITVDFRGIYDSTEMDLGESFGWRLGLPWSYFLNHMTTMTIEPSIERRGFDRSATQTLTSNGANVGTVFEPRSETIVSGLRIGISRSF